MAGYRRKRGSKASIKAVNTASGAAKWHTQLAKACGGVRRKRAMAAANVHQCISY